MRTVATTLLSLALMVPTVTQTPSAGRGDEAAIRRVVERHDAARNREDWKALGQLFREDAEQLTSAGEWRRGRAAIEKGVAQTMAGAYKGGTYVTKVEAVRMRYRRSHLLTARSRSRTSELAGADGATPRMFW